jgi:hypothetical protein
MGGGGESQTIHILFLGGGLANEILTRQEWGCQATHSIFEFWRGWLVIVLVCRSLQYNMYIVRINLTPTKIYFDM